MAIKIKLEQFEGPFDLLYHLIEKNKIDIKDIPIAEITEQYMKFIEEMQEFDMDNASEFLLMAATLIKIKSKMLLPIIENENEDAMDPREELVQRLLEYKKYKEAANNFLEREEFSKILLKQNSELDKYVTIKKVNPEDILVDLSFDEITEAFIKILKIHNNKLDNIRSDIKVVKKDIYTIEDKMKLIIERLSKTVKINFLDLFKLNSSRQEKIVTFLAILELIKLRKITIKQNKMFGNIEVGCRRQEVGKYYE